MGEGTADNNHTNLSSISKWVYSAVVDNTPDVLFVR